jgi:glucose-1-phosphate thymidylyltransferase
MTEMKGVVLAGGKGTRLGNLTKVTNKHLLPVGSKPMIQHCVEKLTGAGIADILVVTGGEHIGHIAEFLGSGRDFGCRMTYKVQDEAGGIAQALGLAEDFVDGDKVCVILGDNIFEDGLAEYASDFLRDDLDAMVLLKEVSDPQRFGVAEVEPPPKAWGMDMEAPGRVRVVSIEEKPAVPKSNLIVTGIYFYAGDVFRIIRTLRPSARGELEITDVNNEFVRRGALSCRLLGGWWTDAGTPESYRRANALC